MSLINIDLSDTIESWKNKTNQLASTVGDLALLNDSAVSLVASINSLETSINGLQSGYDSDILSLRIDVYGDSGATVFSLSRLNTVDKSSIISAINSLQSDNDSDILALRTEIYGDSGGILDLSALNTTDKSSIISAINELDRRSIDVYNSTGILLNT